MKTLWNGKMASNVDIECDAENWGPWEWLKRPVLDVMIKVEVWDVVVKLMTVVKKDNLIEIRAYFPIKEVPILKESLKSHPRIFGPHHDRKIPKFECAVWCMGCRKETDHDSDECRVAIVMDS
jgi:hypothetical protein